MVPVMNLRSRATAARQPHKLEVVGSAPTSAFGGRSQHGDKRGMTPTSISEAPRLDGQATAGLPPLSGTYSTRESRPTGILTIAGSVTAVEALAMCKAWLNRFDTQATQT